MRKINCRMTLRELVREEPDSYKLCVKDDYERWDISVPGLLEVRGADKTAPEYTDLTLREITRRELQDYLDAHRHEVHPLYTPTRDNPFRVGPLEIRVGLYADNDDCLMFEDVTVPIWPPEPLCLPGREHDWEEAGQARGYGGGVIEQERCKCCIWDRTVNTWDQDNPYGLGEEVHYWEGEWLVATVLRVNATPGGNTVLYVRGKPLADQPYGEYRLRVQDGQVFAERPDGVFALLDPLPTRDMARITRAVERKKEAGQGLEM